MFKWAGLALAIIGAIIALIAGFGAGNIGWSVSGIVIFVIGVFAITKG